MRARGKAPRSPRRPIEENGRKKAQRGVRQALTALHHRMIPNRSRKMRGLIKSLR